MWFETAFINVIMHDGKKEINFKFDSCLTGGAQDSLNRDEQLNRINQSPLSEVIEPQIARELKTFSMTAFQNSEQAPQVLLQDDVES